MYCNLRKLLLVILLISLLLCACGSVEPPVYSLDNIPPYSGKPYVEIESNQPQFTQEEKKDVSSWEVYSELDRLNRCGPVMANIGRDIMPTEERGNIGQVKPTGWQTVKYEFVDGKYLYNRCHLIGYQLTGENANEKNLITGTRYLNVEGMLPFENMVADYVYETGNHVLYRVTPCFEGDELVARGVLMEGWSVEDHGEGICFFVYVYNVQPGVEIDYVTGISRLAGDMLSEESCTYILNTNSKKFHTEDCSQAEQIAAHNRQQITATREIMIAQGYMPAGCCDP